MAAFQAQQAQFLKLGWKELPGTMTEAAFGSGMFHKSNFTVSVTTSEAGRPDKAGVSQVYITNFGNVHPGKLPIVKNAKSLFASEATAMYVTELPPAEAVDATRKLLLEAGWEPYGQHGIGTENAMLTFKRNAIQVQASIGVAPAQGNKTSITYSALLLSADIPAPATAAELQYTDMQKTLRFTSADSYADVARYYRDTLTKRGWKATTEELVTSNDRFKRPTGMLIFRNSAKDYLSLDLTINPEKQTQAVVKHLTADEFARLEERARAEEQKRLAEKEKKPKEPTATTPQIPDADAVIKQALEDAGGKKGKVALPILGELIKKVNQTSDNVLQIKLPAGKGKPAADFIRKQLVAGGWKLDDDQDLDESAGNFTFKKGTSHVTMTFVDTGVTDVTMMLIGIGTKIEATKAGATPKAEAEPVDSAKPTKKPMPDKPTAEKPTPEPEKTDTPKKSTVKLEKLPNQGKLVMGETTHKLTSIVAYTAKWADEPHTIVYATEKPTNLDKLKTSLKKNGTDDGVFDFQPQVKLVLDTTGKVIFMSLNADGASVSSNSNLEGDATVEDGRVRGTAKLSKPGEFFKKTYTFELSFDTDLLNAAPAKK
jgi:hypothetical protein